MPKQNLKNHIAIISGALGDIGSAIALEFAARGADIALGDITPPEKANGLIADIEKRGRKARYDRVDVADFAAVTQWVKDVSGDMGPPTLIIPNAAIVTLKTIAEISPEEWTREISINLNGAFYMAQAAGLLLLQQQREGRVVFVGSWAAERPQPHIPAYSVAKAGLRMLMQCMAVEWAPQGVLVNEVAPGIVNAGLSGKIFDTDPQLKENARSRVPVQHLIEVEEVAAHVAYLCDPMNRHMSGTTLTFDGGLSLQGTLTPNIAP